MHYTNANSSAYDPYMNPLGSHPPDPTAYDPNTSTDPTGDYGDEWGMGEVTGEAQPGVAELDPRELLNSILEQLYDLTSKRDKTAEDMDEIRKLLVEYKRLTGSDKPGFMF